MEEGISEASAISTWTSAATAYSLHDVEMLPFYIYYSIFGFQRVGDQIWAAADQRSRGFLIGATAGRTTLSGEGLQHQDGSSHLDQMLAGSNPIVVASDYVRAVPQQIAPFVNAKLTVLGTDGFGRSANRVELRRFFEVDRHHIALAAIEALVREGSVSPDVMADALERFNIDADAPAPWTV